MNDRGEAVKSEAMSLLHHDIRSALGDVLGGLQLVDAEALDPASRRQLERVCASAEMLVELTSSALTAPTETARGAVSRTCANEMHRKEAHRRDTRLSDVVDRLRRRWDGHASARGGEFRIEVRADLSTQLNGQATAVERILSNLVENAITHAALGRVILSVHETGGDALRFAVTDEGPGFSDAALGRLFSFGGRPGTDPGAGAGLGLHIAKHLALELGSDIRVSNTCDQCGDVTGACVSFTLPVPAQVTRDTLAKPPRFKGMRILIADDNDTSRTLIAQILRGLGATCTAVDNGKDAYTKISTELFDLAVIDSQMPRMSGIETIRAIRRLKSVQRHIPILVATGMVLDDERMRLFDAGADTILTKPILSAEVLGATVQEMIEGDGDGGGDISRIATKTTVTPFAPPATVQSTAAGAIPRPTHPPIWADTKTRNTRAGRLAHLVEIAGPLSQLEFIERLSSDLARCRATLAIAFYERDLRVIRAQTHVLISLTGAIGAGALHDAVQAMNTASHKADWPALHSVMAEVWPDLEAVCEEVRVARIDMRAVEDPEVRPA